MWTAKGVGRCIHVSHHTTAVVQPYGEDLAEREKTNKQTYLITTWYTDGQNPKIFILGNYDMPTVGDLSDRTSPLMLWPAHLVALVVFDPLGCLLFLPHANPCVRCHHVRPRDGLRTPFIMAGIVVVVVVLVDDDEGVDFVFSSQKKKYLALCPEYKCLRSVVTG